MPGTLVVTTLSDGTNSTSATNAIQGSAKAWVNFNGVSGSVAARSSFNLSSVTRAGGQAGDYTLTLSTSLTDNTFSLVATGNRSVGTDYQWVVSYPWATAPTSSTARMISSGAGAGADFSYICVSINR